ncbi:MAG: hypothetical protein AAF487_03660 [Bacteroidota bacterium]
MKLEGQDSFEQEYYENDRSGRTAAALAYIPVIGLIAAVLLHGNNKTSLSAFHLRQGIGMHVAMLIIYFFGNMIQIIPVLGWFVNWIFWLAVILLLFFGFIYALNEKKQLLPFIGETFQKIFSGLD